MMVIVAGLGAGVLIALIATLGDATLARDRALRLQSHSYEVMILTRGLSSTMARAEATLGRFVISADRTIGQQYSDEWIQAGQQIDRLESLTLDDRRQRARIAALRAAYRERGDELSLIALSTRYGKNEQALARYYRARDATSLGQIRTHLDGLVTAERSVLTRRSADADRTLARSNLMTRILAVFGVLIVLAAILLGALTVRATAQRAIADADADAERERAELLEAAVAAATDELHAEAREREVAEAQLRQMQKLEAIGQLTGGIAHDFNNMLAVVLGGIELAKRRHAEGKGDIGRHLDSAAEGASRASALTRRLLAFARSEPLLPRATDAGALIAGMSDLLDRTLGDAIRVVTKDRGAGWNIWVDRHGLENAVLNLAVNARDAMDGRGTLTITTGTAILSEHQVGRCAAGDYVAIAVSDTGCGMAPEVVERVFEPFFTTKPVGKGTGLGLSQIFGFIQQSEGEIAITSAPGQGCTVTLYLPRHVAVEPADSASVSRVEPLRLASASLDILVVEDDPRVLASTVAVLEELGHRPIACADPLAARAVALAVPALDLILSDVLMPTKTGPELVAELQPLLPHVAVLFVTGFAGEAGEQDGFGGHDVLRKPFTIAALSMAIDRAVAGRATFDQTPIAAAG